MVIMGVKEKIKNARKLYDLAIKELTESEKEPEKIRDASEKAWGATVNVVEALIEAKTGKEIIKGKDRTNTLVKLVETDKAIPYDIQARYFSREDQLHGDCFYVGKCEPRDEIKRRIRETKEFIDDIEKLTENE